MKNCEAITTKHIKTCTLRLFKQQSNKQNLLSEYRIAWK